MDKYEIDSHKLLYHVARVNDWLQGKDTYPIYAEVSPSGSCNHRCGYCGLDFMRYRQVFLDANVLKDRLSEMAALGLKGVMYAGEGEPLLHPAIAGIISQTKRSGIDVAVSTNGVLLNRQMAQQLLPVAEWIKVSVDAGKKETYGKIHHTSAHDFSRVMANMSYAARLRRKDGYPCALGIQIVLLPDNKREVLLLARIAKDIGMDYLVVKPYSHHPSSITRKYKHIKYAVPCGLAEKLSKLNSGAFHVVLRTRAMEKWNDAAQPYKRCLALPFWCYIDAEGGLWGCGVYLRDKRFLYGNIYTQGAAGILNGEKRRRALEAISRRLDLNKCRINCRMDEVNRYLWKLKHLPPHVNFI